MHIVSINFAKTLVWKHEYDVKTVTSQAAHTKYKWPPHATEWNPPLWKFSAYATVSYNVSLKWI